MTYYLKYRSQTIDELDLAEVRDSLTKIVSSGQIPHAFLFAGPKGTGKTSAARILAKIVNCEKPKRSGEPCNKCEQCVSISKGNNLDVIELDAASHRGIDDIRVLRDAVKLSPARAKKKVYIIDEAHMLTLEASNALLKTLEEPPSHVLFILATTNPEKLIVTIRSRTVYIPFRKATVKEISRSLERIIQGEKIKIDKNKDALVLIAQAADGSFRDAAKILEQLVAEKISLQKQDLLKEYLYKNKEFNTDNFFDLLLQQKVKEVIAEIENFVVKNGGSAEYLSEVILVKLRAGLLSKMGIGEEVLSDFDKENLIYLIELFSKAALETRTALIEQLPLEMAVIKWSSEKPFLPGEEGQEEKNIGKKEIVVEVAKNEKIEVIPQKALGIVKNIKEFSEETWKTILVKVKSLNTSIEALLRAARPISFDGETLTLGVFYKFHKEHLEDNRNRTVFENAVGEVVGKPVRVICTLTEPLKKISVNEDLDKKTVLTESKDQDIIKIAEEIFSR